MKVFFYRYTGIWRNKACCFSILFIVFLLLTQATEAQVAWNPNYKIGTIDGVYGFSAAQTPSQLTTIEPAIFPSETGCTYQWQSSTSPLFTSPVNAAGTSTGASYTFPGPLTQTTYFKRITTKSGTSVTSNISKISLVSANWEDLNYIREHDILTTGITTFQQVDALTIGQKLQTTTYLDGLGRSTEKVSRETATSTASTWGDIVQFSQYDAYGRQPKQYLPYTTSTQSGKYKTTQLTEQPQYFTTNYTENSAFTSLTYDNSPLNRVTNVKESGTNWAASTGNSVLYDLNTSADNVQIWYVDYTRGDFPSNAGAYAANTLLETAYTDVDANKVIEYTDNAGKLILKKVQAVASPSAAHSGWICTYFVYDDFGLLRYQIQPEAVNYLDANSWVFTTQVLNELCFQYDYDDKGRTIWKKAPGAQPLKMMYDARDRMVFTQDGNQAALTTPQWTANLYDDLDRPVLTTLYNTTKTDSALLSDIALATTTTTVSTTPPSNPITDLVVSNRDLSITTYNAQTSITLADGFSSGTGDAFTAQISGTAATSPAAISSSTYSNPITSANLSSSTVCTILKYLFYDNYTFANAKPFDNTFTNTTAYSTSDPNVIPIATSARTLSYPTGSLTRVLGTTVFLAATDYYDEKGRHVQTQEDNIKTGTDATTMQYHWDGRLLSTCNNHTAPGTDYIRFLTLTKNIFDKLGRVTSIQKGVGAGNPLKTVSVYDYDDVGRVKTKHFDPTYTVGGNAELESLNYTFNIHNQITGINKDYAKKTSGSYSKWGHFFGMYLGFDKIDGIFTKAELNGQVSGILWNTQGDDAQRLYNYQYDAAGRLINANYTEQQHPGDGYSKTKMDFSVTGTSGGITYDLNGNLLTMLQKGIQPGAAAPITVDDLRYSYTAQSNKLQSVTDQMTATTQNGLYGDFKDGANAAGTADYVYDNNGNVVIDLNKNVQSLSGGAAGTPGIHYNFLDKPDQIRIVGKGTITITYSADGDKLQRVYTPETAGVTVTTTYINQFVYQKKSSGGGDSLQFMNFEEGRVRVMQSISQGDVNNGLIEDGNLNLPGSKRGAWDYFVTDYQENVRMILTEETHTAYSTATMEVAQKTYEDGIFGQAGAGNEVEATRVAKPAGWTNSAAGASVCELGNTFGKTLGPNTLQKVMAGDGVSATTLYYCAAATTGAPNTTLASAITNSLLAVLGSSGAATNLVKGNAAGVTTQLGGNAGFLGMVQPASTTGTVPQAYLTILFFDERFNFIAAADGGAYSQQIAGTTGANGATLTIAPVKAPKNGYAYVYISNRSDGNVYFDNLKVQVQAGNIIEENHYYAFGLKIAPISSAKLGDGGEGGLKNNYDYNDKELIDDGDLNWYDYGFRNYDPQIGRFAQLDPLTSSYPELTPYQYASNDPINNIDIDGLEGGISTAATAASTTSIVAGITEGTVATLPDVIVRSTIKIAAKASSTASKVLSVTGSLFKGILQSAWGTVTGAGHVVMHPVQTVEGLASVVAHPIQTLNAVENAAKNGYKEFKDGDANTRANMLGQAIGQIGQLLIGTGEANAAIKTTEVAEDIGEASQVVKGTEAAEAAEQTGVQVKKCETGNCFVQGTSVWMAAGMLKAIEKVKTGDSVYAYDTATGRLLKREVIQAYVKHTTRLVRIVSAGEVIYATPEHPFYVNHSWVWAGNLKVNDSLSLPQHRKAAVTSIKVIDTSAAVYNFTVQDAHDYFVGKHHALVHNDCGKSLGSTRTTAKEWLKKAGNLERDQLTQDLEGAGFKKVFEDKGMTHFEHGDLKIRLDPPQSGTPYNHMHLNYGGNKGTYDISLKPVSYKSPAAHIPIK